RAVTGNFSCPRTLGRSKKCWPISSSSPWGRERRLYSIDQGCAGGRRTGQRGACRAISWGQLRCMPISYRRNLHGQADDRPGGSVAHQEEYHGGNLGASLFNIGETLMGMQLTDNVRALDFLCSLPMVDTQRIGVTGASGGGNQSMWLAALDERIKAVVPVVSV